MSNLRYQPTKEDIIQSRIQQNSSLRTQRRMQMMEQKRQVQTAKVTLLPPLRVVEEECAKIKQNNYYSIDTLDSYLIGDHAVHRIIMNANVCSHLISLVPMVDNKVLKSILRLFISFTSEKNGETYTIHLIESGLMNVFENFFNKDFDILNHFLWLISNIASDGIPIVQLLMNNKIIDKINYIITMIAIQFPVIREGFQMAPVQVTRNDIENNFLLQIKWEQACSLISMIVWLCSNIARTRYIGTNEEMSSILFIMHVIISPNMAQALTPNVISDALWAIAFFSENDHYDGFFKNEQFVEYLMEYISSPQKHINTPALRIAGNM